MASTVEVCFDPKRHGSGKFTGDFHKPFLTAPCVLKWAKGVFLLRFFNNGISQT